VRQIRKRPSVRSLRWLALPAILAASPVVAAGTATTTFSVSATVVATCSVSAAALSFGTSIPTPINLNVDATSTLTATCSANSPYTVALNAGTGTGATFAARKLSSGANSLNYTLYTDANRSTVWGDGTGSSSLSNQTGTGAAQTITVYGRISSGQTPAIGSYTDTVTVTISF
jgi:spore coat protein U-like protein